MARHIAVPAVNPASCPLPVQFQLIRYTPDSATSNRYVIEHYTGKVLDVGRKSRAELSVPLDKPATVLDYRFGTSLIEHPVHSLVTNGQWPRIEDPEYLTFAKAQVANNRDRDRSRALFKARATIVLRILIALVLVLPAVLYVLRKILFSSIVRKKI